MAALELRGHLILLRQREHSLVDMQLVRRLVAAPGPSKMSCCGAAEKWGFAAGRCAVAADRSADGAFH